MPWWLSNGNLNHFYQWYGSLYILSFKLLKIQEVNNCDLFTEEWFFFSLQLRNGGLPTSPLMLMNPTQGDNQNGRICQSTLPNEKNTSSNLLYINFVSNGDANQGKAIT